MDDVENSHAIITFSSPKCSGRPTIEIDIMPDFILIQSLNITELMDGIQFPIQKFKL